MVIYEFTEVDTRAENRSGDGIRPEPENKKESQRPRVVEECLSAKRAPEDDIDFDLLRGLFG